MLSLFKNKFKKKNPFTFLPLINNKINLDFKYCEIMNVNGTRIPKYKDKSIYSDKISELEYDSNDDMLKVYRVYDKHDDGFLQLQFKNGILNDVLYVYNREYVGYNNLKLNEQELILNNERYLRDLFPDEEVFEPILIHEHFKLDDCVDIHNCTIFYKAVEDELDEFEDSLVYFEIKEDEVYKYDMCLIDVSKVSINSN